MKLDRFINVKFVEIWLRCFTPEWALWYVAVDR